MAINPFQKTFYDGMSLSTDDYKLGKDNDYLANSSQIAFQGGPINPATNAAQDGKSGSNAMQDAYKAVTDFWSGNQDEQFIKTLNLEDQSKLQGLAVQDPQEYYRELGRRKGAVQSRQQFEDLYGSEGKMTKARSVSGGGGVGEIKNIASQKFNPLEEFERIKKETEHKANFGYGEEQSKAKQFLYNLDEKKYQFYKPQIAKKDRQPWEFEFSGLGMGLGISGGPVA